MKYKRFAIFSTDMKAGGISAMLGIHSVALTSIGFNLNVIIPGNSDASKTLNCIVSEENLKKSIEQYNFSKWNLYTAKLGLNDWLCKALSNVDGCFVHNARIIPLIKRACSLPVFAVNHTGKKSQNKYLLQADIVFSVNKTMQEQLIHCGLNSSKSILCPNALLKFPKQIIPKTLDTVPTIGAIGRMVDKKGFFDFINALKIMKTRGIKFKAELAGDGILLDKLKQYSVDLPELKFLGWIENKEYFFNNLDIFCQPSLFEPFGLTLIEAMSMSCPVVSTNCDGPKDIIISGKNGFLVPIGDPDSMAKTIIGLIRDKSLRNRIGKSARDEVEKKYRIENISKILKKNIFNYYS